MAHSPGDRVLTFGTIHLNAANKGLVVELSHGIVPKDGAPDLTGQNVVLPWNEDLGKIYDSLASLALSHIEETDDPALAKLKGIELYDPPTATEK